MKFVLPCAAAAGACLAFASATAAAPTYKDRLMQDITITMAPIEPAIPDDLENDFWRCIASSFVEVKIPVDDLAELDRLSAGNWNPKNELVRKYGNQLMSAMKNPSGSDWGDIMMFAESLGCPETVEGYFDAYKG
jgi:hypothetical protein